MRRIPAVAALVVLSVLPFSLLAQQPTQVTVAPTRDQQAVAILASCVTASGGAETLLRIANYSETGNITYFWGEGEVSGPVTVYGSRYDQFRLDAQLPEGKRSWTVNSGQGWLRDTDGKSTRIPIHAGMHQGSLTLPYTWLLAALRDTSVAISLVAQETFSGAQVYVVRTQKNYTLRQDPTGDWTKWSARQYLVDAKSFALLGTREIVHPNDSAQKELEQVVLYSNYRQVDGISVPFAIAETISGQKTWAIQLNTFTLNPGLTQQDFQ
jgi:hypothetical protein